MDKNIDELLADMEDMLHGRGRHSDHTQEQIGRCVYCSCGDRAQPVAGFKLPAGKRPKKKKVGQFHVVLPDGFICYKSDNREKAEEIAAKHQGSEIQEV